jgi:hypothetical protein
MKNLIVAICLLTLSLSAWSSELYTPQPVLQNDEDKIVAKVRFEQPQSGDLYLATIIDAQLWFITKKGEGITLTASPNPFKANETFEGEYSLLSLDGKGLPPGNYPLYQIVTQPNTNPLDEKNWIGGPNGLNFLSFTLGLPQKVRVLPFNDLGMHCMDSDFSVFSILPPFNVVNAQVVGQEEDGEPELLDANDIEVRYSAITDRKGSINSNSLGKTNFWQYAEGLFGVKLAPGESLTGFYMPADHPEKQGEQALHYKSEQKWFSAEGIPIVPKDDMGQLNPYQTLRISAYDKKTGEALGATDVVVPVSSETRCGNCHLTGKMGANDPDVVWATDENLEIQTKRNILILHDKQYKTQLLDNTPVLCASCHYSAALDLEGKGAQAEQQGQSTLSQAMHLFHGELRDSQGNPVIPTGNDVPVEQSCYNCHPGKTTQCQRGAMKTVGLSCTACHGGLLAVGGKFPLKKGGSLDGSQDGKTRRPWFDVPRCQSCHTGDALNHLTGEDLVFFEDGIRLMQAYRTGDESASPILSENKRFAENEHTLFRNSHGHNKIACEGCHGSTHAIWPNPDQTANDNLTAIQLQGHQGTIIECDTCHAPGSLEMTLKGPHGLHNINDPRWIDQHYYFYQTEMDSCQACHGKSLEGTPLSKMAATRTFNLEDKTVILKKGQLVSCDLCHEKPIY